MFREIQMVWYHSSSDSQWKVVVRASKYALLFFLPFCSYSGVCYNVTCMLSNIVALE